MAPRRVTCAALPGAEPTDEDPDHPAQVETAGSAPASAPPMDRCQGRVDGGRTSTNVNNRGSRRRQDQPPAVGSARGMVSAPAGRPPGTAAPAGRWDCRFARPSPPGRGYHTARPYVRAHRSRDPRASGTAHHAKTCRHMLTHANKMACSERVIRGLRGEREGGEEVRRPAATGFAR